ncbi:cytochrome P450 [Crossiella cryophila]|uniref:Cytochrome P450 n=1 Tax=Crossiella cryophila TaxID=43355 RepID=A0A7W7FUW0_9PSEU|nr:cytochrome P450 [Crossiella cryophila]MBB4678425.1 cytochrome P450 [Crossiella cryophila]
MSTRTLVAPRSLAELDLADPRLHAEQDLSEVWRTLRRSEPVHRHRPVGRAPGFWVVTRFADAAEVYLDTDRFSSAGGNVLATLLQGGDSASGVMAAVTDGSRHRDLRSVLLKAFSPRVLTGVVQAVEQNSRELVNAALDQEVCDFAVDVAGKLPITVICDLLGVPVEDREFLLGLTKTALSSDTADQTPFEIWQARNDILSYFGKLAEERRRNPGTDAVSVLVTGTVGGQPLTQDEVVANCYSLILGGDETSRLSMIGAVLAFTEHPDQWAALKSGAVTVESAADEVLRWTTPAIHFGRTATQDSTLNGVRIAKGEIVTVWNASANRDEARFPDPDRFDLGRTPNKHLSFGHGPHYCVGAYLGKAEITAMLTALRDQVAAIEPAGPALPIYSNMLSGYRSLPVRLSR